MFTDIAQKLRVLRATQPPQLIDALIQLSNCAAGIDHRGQLVVDYDGYWHHTNTAEQFHAFDTADTTGGDAAGVVGVLPPAGGVMVNPAAVANLVNGNVQLQGGTALTVNGVWYARPSPAQPADNPTGLVVAGNVVVNNLWMRGNILNALGQFQIIANVLLWVADNTTGGDLVSVGDRQITLTDNAGTAPRVAGCIDTYAVDLYSTATNLHVYEDLIDLRSDFTVAIRLKLKYISIRTEQYWSYRETNPPSAVPGVKLQGEWQFDFFSGTNKLRFTASTTPADISPTGVGVPARVGREYPDGSCLSVFVRWNQASKILTLNVLQPGDVGGAATNDETTWSGSYGEYILSEGSEKYLQIKGEGVPQAAFYMDRFAIWGSRLSDGDVKYDWSF